MKLVTIVGGSGVFGSRIAAALASHAGCQVRIAGRDAKRGQRAAQAANATFHWCDVVDRESVRAAITGSHLVIHAAGPFQAADYLVPELCIECATHYLDIADARDYVIGIRQFDAEARRRALLFLSGASSVPAISDAMVRQLAGEFRQIGRIRVMLSPGNRNPRGASTVSAILNYVGKPIRVWDDGRWTSRYGWGEPLNFEFPAPVGWRRLYLCDGPDLELFPAAFAADSVEFRAGLELSILNRMLASIGLARRRLPMPWLPRAGRFFASLSKLLYVFGTKHGAFGVSISGIGRFGRAIERRIALVADTDGPAVPSAPAILLARQIVAGTIAQTGALPCVGLLDWNALIQLLDPCGVRCVTWDA